MQEISEMIKQASKEREDKVNTTDNPIEIANLYKIAHREEKLRKLDKYIEYNWIYRLKEFEIITLRLNKILLELMKKEMIELEKRRKKKQEK
jgi:ribosomal protein L24